MSELFSQYSQPVLPPGTKITGNPGNLYKIIDDTVNAGGFGRIYRAVLNQIYKGNPWKIVALKEFCISPSQFEQYKHTFVGTYTMANIDKNIMWMQSKFRQEAILLKRLNEQRDRHAGAPRSAKTEQKAHRQHSRENHFKQTCRFNVNYDNYTTLYKIVKKKAPAIARAFVSLKQSPHQGKNGQTIGITIRETTKETRTRGTPALT